MYFQYTPSWDIMRLAGGGLALGLVLAALLQLRALPAVIFTTLSAFLPMYAMYRSFYFGDYTSVTPALPLGLVWGGVIGWLIRGRVPELAYGQRSAARPPGTGWRSHVRTVMDIPHWPEWARIVLAGLGGAGFAAVAWIFIGQTYETFPSRGSAISWDGVMALFMVSVFIGAIMSYASKTLPRLSFFVVALAGLLALELVGGRLFYDDAFQALNPVGWNAPLFNTVPFAPLPNAPIIYFDAPQIRNHMMLVTTLPMVLSFALGAYALLLWRDTWHYVGAPHAAYERGGWLTGVLVYGLLVTAAVGIFALFSMHVSVPWGIAWSVWGFTTWLCLMATWRWALWGAQGVIVASLLLIVGGAAADIFESGFPPLQQMVMITLHPGPQATLLEIIATAPLLWMLWGFGMVLSLRSAGQRKVWGYGSSVGLSLIFAFAILLSRLPIPLDNAAVAVDNSSRLLGLDWTGGIPALTIRVAFLWGLWGLGLLAMLSGVRYRQLWSGIALVSMIIGWFVIVLFGGVPGSYAILAATHAGLVIYALQSEWDKMEPDRFRPPWTSGVPTDGTLRMPAVAMTDAPSPEILEPQLQPQYVGPTVLRESPAQLKTQPGISTRLSTSEYNAIRDDSHTRPKPTMASVLPPTESIVDEEAGASGEFTINTESFRTAPTPSDPQDMRTAVDPNVPFGSKQPGEFPRLRMGQTGPLPGSPQPPIVPRIRLDTTALDKNRMADTMPPVGNPAARNAGDEPPTVEAFDLPNAPTQAFPAEPKAELPSDLSDAGTMLMPKIKLGTGPLQSLSDPAESEPTMPPADVGSVALPRIKLGTGPLQSPVEPSESGPTMPPTPPHGSGSTVAPKIKMGGDLSQQRPPTPDLSSTTAGPTVPGVKINLSSVSGSQSPDQPNRPRIRLDGDAKMPPSPPPTMPVPPELKAALQKPDDVDEGDFEELPPDED